MSGRQFLALIMGALLVVAALYDQSYQGLRADAVHARQECHRRIADRHAEAEGWYSAYLSRHAQAAATANRTLHDDYQLSAGVYLSTAEDLNSRTDRAHSVQWPPGSGELPLGPGRLDCDVANPLPTVFRVLG